MISDFSPEELREIGLAPSREASSNYPEGSGALVPPGVQREDSVGALLASIGQTLPPLPGQTLPPLPTGTPGSGAPVDSPPECFDGLRLAIQSHSVHKVENADTEDREYVVSNLRVFQIEVVLVNERNELAQTTNVANPNPNPNPSPSPNPNRNPNPNPNPNPNQVALHASLLTENGLDLVWPNPQEPMLTGETEAVIIGGPG